MRKHVSIDITTGETKIEELPPSADNLSPAELMDQIIHDCAECRELRARGVTPEIVIVEKSPPAKRDVIRDRRPRWRHLKRRARR